MGSKWTRQLAFVRRCEGCAREFVPSSRHRLCTICRMRNVCECGAPKMLASKLCDDCCDRSGPFNGQWRGGRTRSHAGYVLVKKPGHPRSWAKKQYVFEHILVMEDHLGRHLYPDENVHHLNGVKDDNRLENLELWVRPQPSGIRASDALEWAREIVVRYA